MQGAWKYIALSRGNDTIYGHVYYAFNAFNANKKPYPSFQIVLYSMILSDF